jgi:hypothetical protein
MPNGSWDTSSKSARLFDLPDWLPRVAGGGAFLSRKSA